MAVALRRAGDTGLPYWYENHARAAELVAGPGHVPDIIEFTQSDRYLNRPVLYPRQGTLLKVIFLQKELLTEYDKEVIGEWSSGFSIPDLGDAVPDHYEGSYGIQPDVLQRMDILRRCPCGHDRGLHRDDAKCSAPGLHSIDGGRPRPCQCDSYQGSKWFRQVEFVGGRRGSKGFIGGVSGAYVLWNYHSLPDPQAHYGVERDKQLSCQVFAGKKEQARDNQWRDIVTMVRGAPCFWPFESKSLTDYLSIYSRQNIVDFVEGAIDLKRTTMDLAAFTIEPKEATVMAARGVAAFMQFYDEFAHVVKGVAKVDGGDLEDSAKPALDQFGMDGFAYQGSSPWTQQGRFYENYLSTLEFDPETREPTYPERLMVQLKSWDPYIDWRISHTKKLRPTHRIGDRTSRHYCVKNRAMQEYDQLLKNEEKANPENFRVERRAQWATALDAYLSESHVAKLWEPYNGAVLQMRDRGVLAVTYRAHGDPSKSGANFGFAIAHREGPDANGMFHVVFDYITHWEPQDFPRSNPLYTGGDDQPELVYEIDYDVIALHMESVIDLFQPGELTFDQWNSTATIQRLQKYAHARASQLPKRTTVYERSATAPLNWKTYETFKTALGMGYVHAPFYEMANRELLFLQKTTQQKVDHPTSGPVQTKDVADCIAIVTYELIGEQMSALLAESLGMLPVHGAEATAGGLPQNPMGGDPAMQANPAQAHHDLSRFSRTVARGSTYRGMPRQRRR